MNHDLDSIRNASFPAESYEIESFVTEINFQDNELRDIQSKESCGRSVRVIADGRLGVARGGHNASHTDLLNRAAAIARFGRDAGFAFPAGPAEPITDSHGDPALTVDAMLELGNRFMGDLTAALPGWKFLIMLNHERARKHLVNSRGLDWTFHTGDFGYHILGTLARDGDIIEIHEARARFPDASRYESVIRSIREHATACLTPARIDGGSYPVLLHPCALGSFLESLDEGIDARNIFDGVSPLRDRIGERVMDERVSIWDDPVEPSMPGFSPRSDEGVAAIRKPLVQNGILRNYLANLEYAARLNLQDGSNGFRSISAGSSLPGADSHISGTNRMIDSGRVPFEDMLRDMKHGIVLIQSWDAWSGNLINGDISGSLHLGFLVKNGRLAGRLKDMRLSGNIYDLLGKQLVDLSIECPDTIHSDQRAPWMMVRDVTIC